MISFDLEDLCKVNQSLETKDIYCDKITFVFTGLCFLIKPLEAGYCYERNKTKNLVAI